MQIRLRGLNWALWRRTGPDLPSRQLFCRVAKVAPAQADELIGRLTSSETKALHGIARATEAKSLLNVFDDLARAEAERDRLLDEYAVLRKAPVPSERAIARSSHYQKKSHDAVRRLRTASALELAHFTASPAGRETRKLVELARTRTAAPPATP